VDTWLSIQQIVVTQLTVVIMTELVEPVGCNVNRSERLVLYSGGGTKMG